MANQTQKDLFKSHNLCRIHSTVAAIIIQIVQIIVKSIILICLQSEMASNTGYAMFGSLIVYYLVFEREGKYG